MTDVICRLPEWPLPPRFLRSILAKSNQEEAMINEAELFKEPELNRMTLFLVLVAQKFKSGNDIEVESITLTRQEVEEIYPELLKF